MINIKYFEKFNGNQGVSIETIKNLDLPVYLPICYIDFLTQMNGGEGFIGAEYLILYKAEELLQVNLDYEVNEFFPGIFLIGTNGGGEAVALDLRTQSTKFILIPFTFEYEAIIELGTNTSEFFKRVFEQGYFD